METYSGLMALLRIASYNIRVDHTDDIGTVHDWPNRRPLVASSLLGRQG